MDIVAAANLLCLFFFGATPAVFGPGHFVSRRALDHVDVDYRVQKPILILHEPVVVTFSVHNGTSEQLTLNLGTEGRQFFQFSLTTPDGKVVKSQLPSSWQVETVTFGSGKVDIPPGGDYRQTLLLDQWFDFDEQGTYFVSASLESNITLSGGGTLAPEKQDFRFQVGPRDADRLRRVCEGLAKEVEEAASLDQGKDPAVQLSYVRDPVAVPYLAQALNAKAGSFDWAIIPSLERIGNDQAVEVLLSALNDKFGDVSDRAEGALHHLENRISDPVQKQRVSRALEAKAAARASH